MKPFIIAEIGSNWYVPGTLGDYRDRLRLTIREAAVRGANAVKLQLFTADGLYSKKRAGELYQRARIREFPLSLLPTAREVSDSFGIRLWASIFNLSYLPPERFDVISLLDGLKIASGDFTYIALTNRMLHIAVERIMPIGISMGATGQVEIMNFRKRNNLKGAYVIPFHCRSVYPCPTFDAGLSIGIKKIELLYKDFARKGFSDHTMSTDIGGVAVGAGYDTFEKHFTLDRQQGNPDESVSLLPDEFETYVQNINSAYDIMFGNTTTILENEKQERKMARRGSDGLRPKED